VIRGDWRDRKAEIRLGKEGPVIATLSRDKWTARDLILDVQEYFVYVAPGGRSGLLSTMFFALTNVQWICRSLRHYACAWMTSMRLRNRHEAH
jgi:hypothetical protein